MSDSPGIILSKVFRSTDAIVNGDVSAKLFGGVFSAIQKASLPTHIVFFLPIFVALLVLWHHKFKSNLVLRVSLFLGTLLSALLSVRISQGWDEFFLNLRHSYWLSHGAGYSVNGLQKIEATVDFIPFFLIGVLGKIGLPMEECGIAISFLGNILCLLAAFSICKRLTKNETFSLLSALLMALFPPLLYVGASGFMATVFSGLILWSIHDLCLARDEHERRGQILAASLCFFRMEGILFTGLLWLWTYALLPLYQTRDSKKLDWTKILKTAGIFLGPFFVLALGRYLYFGRAVPVPVLFKSSIFSFFYWKMGFKYGGKILIEYKFHLALVVSSACFFLARRRNPQIKKVMEVVFPIFLSLGIFELPYHFGGGDWFPVDWARYLMPFLLFSYLCFWILSFLFLQTFVPKRPILALGIAMFALSPVWFDLILIPRVTAVSKAKPGVFYRIGPEILKAENRWDRVDRLSAYGKLMKQTLAPHSSIASTELATIYYFSEMEILDLLGLVNIEIAKAPLDPFSRTNPMSRRRLPTTLDRNMPSAIALFEMVGDLKLPVGSLTSAQMVQTLREVNLCDDTIESNYYRVGKLSRLEKLGYRHVAVFLPGLFFNYWVHESKLPEHEQRLIAAGLKQEENISIPYVLSGSIQARWPE